MMQQDGPTPLMRALYPTFLHIILTALIMTIGECAATYLHVFPDIRKKLQHDIKSKGSGSLKQNIITKETRAIVRMLELRENKMPKPHHA